MTLDLVRALLDDGIRTYCFMSGDLYSEDVAEAYKFQLFRINTLLGN